MIDYIQKMLRCIRCCFQLVDFRWVFAGHERSLTFQSDFLLHKVRKSKPVVTQD